MQLEGLRKHTKGEDGLKEVGSLGLSGAQFLAPAVVGVPVEEQVAEVDEGPEGGPVIAVAPTPVAAASSAEAVEAQGARLDCLTDTHMPCNIIRQASRDSTASRQGYGMAHECSYATLWLR